MQEQRLPATASKQAAGSRAFQSAVPPRSAGATQHEPGAARVHRTGSLPPDG